MIKIVFVSKRSNNLLILALLIATCSCSILQNKVATRYHRDLYPHWIDQDKDCQNTRAEVLIKNSVEDIKFKRVSGFFKKKEANLGRGRVFYKNKKPVKKPCNVSYGKWIDPYSNKVFVKASDMDIDHIVSLKNAHLSGAYKWSRSKKRDFANDFDNLLSVDKKLNRQKGSKSPDQWLPPLKSFRCRYLKKWITIKRKYDLQIEIKVQKMYLSHCI